VENKFIERVGEGENMVKSDFDKEE